MLHPDCPPIGLGNSYLHRFALSLNYLLNKIASLNKSVELDGIVWVSVTIRALLAKASLSFTGFFSKEIEFTKVQTIERMYVQRNTATMLTNARNI